MKIPHPNADLLRKLADDESLLIQYRKNGTKTWSEPRPAHQYMSIDNNGTYEYRDASDWRNKFRDAMEQGEVVEFLTFRDGWVVPNKMEFKSYEHKYRIRPKPMTVYAVRYRSGTLGPMLFSTATQAHSACAHGTVIELQEVIK